LQTAISDIEVEHKEFEGHTKMSGNSLPGHEPKNSYDFGCMVHFAYKVIEKKDSSPALLISFSRKQKRISRERIWSLY
jgi:valyl-tRNA synthetase